MAHLSLSGKVKLDSGRTRSFTVKDSASHIVINLKSSDGVVGCLTVQFDGNDEPVIRLKKENDIDIVVSGFTQFKLGDFIKNGGD